MSGQPDAETADLRRRVLADAAMAFAGVPGVEVVDEGDVVRSFAPGRPQQYLNALARVTLDATSIAERLAALETAYRAAGLPMLWWLDDDVRPPDVRDALLAVGLRDPGAEAVMVVSLPGELPAATAEVTVRRVEMIEDLDAWIAVLADAYGWSDASVVETMRTVYDPSRPHGRDERRIQLLARRAGAPVGAASLFRAAGQGWITNVGTIPAARGRGVGRAVTSACLRLAQERGDPTAWLAASTMGEPVYARLGFRTVGRLEHLVGPGTGPADRGAP